MSKSFYPDTKKEQQLDNIASHMAEIVIITCSKCNKEERLWSVGNEQLTFYNRGWRATKEKVYCPDCTPKG